MEELRKEYTLLFNGISDTIRQLERTISELKNLQQRAEATYLEECAEAEEDDGMAPENVVALEAQAFFVKG